MSPQVRLDPDVSEILERKAKREGRSLSAVTNDWLRAALKIGDKADTRSTAGGPCLHPVGRRIGDHCAVCGANAKGAKK